MIAWGSLAKALRSEATSWTTRWVSRLCVIVAVGIGWEMIVRLGLARESVFPPPSALAQTALQMICSGELFRNAWGSISRVLLGFIAAVLVGLVAGVVLACSSLVRETVSPVLDLLRPIPPIAWIPVAILWFGLGTWSAIFIVFVGTFFPVCLGACRGISSVSQAQVNAARCLGADFLLVTTDVVIPAALPQIMTGVRIGTGIAWSSVIAAEMIGVRDGLGYSIQLSRTMLDTEGVFVNMATIGLVGWLMSDVVARCEKHLTRGAPETIASAQRS